MSLLRRFFGSKIVDEDREEYLSRSRQKDAQIASARNALFNELIEVDQKARVFQSAAGEMRLMRGRRD
jgi:hypothetical protein